MNGCLVEWCFTTLRQYSSHITTIDNIFMYSVGFTSTRPGL